VILSLDGIRPTFGGHEKFVFRQSWLKKGVDLTAKDGQIFTRDEALVKLGVGKNMVRSIRYWCLATGLLKDAGKIGATRALAPTFLAEKLLMDGGWDPYLEDVGTLWLLHWQLATNQEKALVWFLTFSVYLESEFNKKRLSAFIAKQFDLLKVRTTSGSITREVDCCLRTYVPSRTMKGGISEEGLDSPLVELDLIRFFPDSGSYHFNVGPKISLPTSIFGYALLNFLPLFAKNRRTVTVEECVYKPGSPGQIFKLDENSVMEFIEKLENKSQGLIRFQETAGIRQILLAEVGESEWQTRAAMMLEDYYARN